jgi:hypothetical protein
MGFHFRQTRHHRCLQRICSTLEIEGGGGEVGEGETKKVKVKKEARARNLPSLSLSSSLPLLSWAAAAAALEAGFAFLLEVLPPLQRGQTCIRVR